MPITGKLNKVVSSRLDDQAWTLGWFKQKFITEREENIAWRCVWNFWKVLNLFQLNCISKLIILNQLNWTFFSKPWINWEMDHFLDILRSLYACMENKSPKAITNQSNVKWLNKTKRKLRNQSVKISYLLRDQSIKY